MRAITSSPQGLDEVDEVFGYSVLVKALNINAPFRVVQAMVWADVDLVKQRHGILDDKLHNLPIHVACNLVDATNGNKLSLSRFPERQDCIQLIMNTYKEGLWQTSDEDTFALHYLLQYKPPAYLVLDMLACYQQVFPTSIKNILCTIDSKGQTPIHIALQNHAPTETIEALLRNEYRGKDVLRMGDGNKYFPLHMAVFNGCTAPVLDMLLTRVGDMYNYNNGNKMSALELAFARDSEPRWMKGFTWADEGLREDGTDRNGVIRGPPRNLLSQRELVMKMIKAMKDNNDSNSKAEITGPSSTSIKLTTAKLQKIVRTVKTCKRNVGSKASGDFKAVLKYLERQFELEEQARTALLMER